MDELSDICKVCYPEYKSETKLYKYKEKYVLVLHIQNLEEEILNKLIFSITDYTKIEYADTIKLSRIDEYGEQIIKSNALDILRKI